MDVDGDVDFNDQGSFSPREEAPALLMYTSGTTGRPKGIVHAHRWVITVDGVTGYQWAPFDDVSDDDRDMDYQLIQVGGGYQITDNLYSSLTFERYDVDLLDGNTAFQAYQLHSMASGSSGLDRSSHICRPSSDTGAAAPSVSGRSKGENVTARRPSRAATQASEATNIESGGTGL